MPKPGDFMRTAARLVENAVTGTTPRRAMVAETAAAEGHSCSLGTVAVFTAPTALTFSAYLAAEGPQVRPAQGAGQPLILTESVLHARAKPAALPL